MMLIQQINILRMQQHAAIVGISSLISSLRYSFWHHSWHYSSQFSIISPASILIPLNLWVLLVCVTSKHILTSLEERKLIAARISSYVHPSYSAPLVLITVNVTVRFSSIQHKHAKSIYHFFSEKEEVRNKKEKRHSGLKEEVEVTESVSHSSVLTGG
jgi:hypothetical protein